MPTSTTHRNLPEPIGSDTVSELRVAATALAAAVDGDVPYLSGTLTARSALTGLFAGMLYYATDTALLYEYNGTIWQTVLLAGPWGPLTPASGFSVTASTEYTGSARQEGDVVRLKGLVQNVSAGSVSGATTATISSSSMFPSKYVTIQAYNPAPAGGFVSLEISPAGLMTLPGTTLGNSQYYELNGQTYTLS
jgi:hypothetical protein